MSQLALATEPAPAGAGWPRWFPQGAVVPCVIGAIAVVAVVVFDLGPPLPFDDDWSMAWSAKQFIVDHRLQIFPVQSALALVQTFVTALLTFGHTDQRLLRLTVVPFILLGAVSSYRIARMLGTAPFWSGVGAVTLLGCPLFLHSATTYMTDVPYVGLLMAATAAGLLWVRRGEARLECIVWATLCPLQRQLGIIFPLAITIGLLAGRKRRSMRRADWLWLAGLWLAVGIAGLLPVVTGVAPPTQGNRISNLLHLSVAHQAQPLFYLPAMMGLVLLPLVGAALYASRPQDRAEPRAAWILGISLRILAAVGIADLIVGLAHFGWGFYPGNLWMPHGLAPTLMGNKASPLPLPLFLGTELLATASFLILLLVRRDLWHWRRLDRAQLFLVAVAVSQFLPLLLLQTTLYDRYYLPILAPLVPLVALRAGTTSKPRLATGWAIGFLLLGQGLYVVGQQDFEAWHVARERAAQLAFAMAPANQVDAGYEANAMAVEIPVYEATGVILGGLARNALDFDYAATGPAHPLIRLEFAPAGDPRPGVDYRALTASGRIVLTRMNRGQ